MRRCLLLFIAFLQFTSLVNAQKVSLSGKVYDTEKNPLYYATIQLKGTTAYDITDEDGAYILENVFPGNHTISIRILGFQTVEKEIKITDSFEDYNFYLEESSLALEEVKVSATVVQSKEGSTTYKIDQQAIKQIQPISLGDILQLLPGAAVESSNLSSMSQADLRNAGSYSSINAFGTSVIVDGNQLSNDANMNEIGDVVTINKGIDLRGISASGVEKVEVVAGVAHAKYGDMTSGTIIVERKAGYTPYYVNFNSTPETYQLGLNKGYRLKGSGFLNADLDYTYSNNKPTSRKRFYQRINAGLKWTNELSKQRKWNHSVSLRYGLSFDGQRKDPDEEVFISSFKNKSHRISLSTNGSLKLFGHTNYSFSGNYTHQYAQKETVEAGPIPIIESLEPGTHITTYSPKTFYLKTESFGKPLNLNGKIETQQSYPFIGLTHNTSSGFGFTYNKNVGEGTVKDKNAVGFTVGDRETEFHNVPASKVYYLFLQDNISLQTESAYYLFKLGVRYDNMYKKYNLISPRLSASAKIKNNIRLRLAYGISYKTPSMAQMYPSPSYFDVINLNHYSEDEARARAVVTTYIYQPFHENIKPAKGQTFEGGFDFEKKDFSLRVTGYHKKISNGISTVSKLYTIDKVIWEAIDEVPGQTPEFVPTDEIVKVSTTFRDYKNTITTKTNGVEVMAQFPKIKPTNTTIYLAGSYMRTYSKDESLRLRSSISFSQSPENRYGLYENPSYIRKLGRSTITIAQHFPQIKMMVTLRTEVNLIKDYYTDKLPSPYPYAYYDLDGNYIEIPEDERDDPKYADLEYPLSRYETTPEPTNFNFHIQLRKETKQGHSFSFYANNFLWYNPTYKDKINNNIVHLHSKLTLGMGFNFKF